MKTSTSHMGKPAERSTHPRSASGRRAGYSRLVRGFTLTELMVAMTGGLVISIAVFLLARQASRFYSREGRTSMATLSNVMGFERLRADIGRTGFLASPNIRRDKNVCNDPIQTPAGWPAYLGHLQSVLIQPIGTGPNGLPAIFAQNSRNPMSITLAGSYASPDQFEVRNIELVSGHHEVFLAMNSHAVQRLAITVNGNQIVPQDTLLGIFGVGRAVRIVDPSGGHHYSVVSGVQGGAQPRIALEDDPVLPTREAGDHCGLIGVDTGALINVVNVIQYSLRSLATNSQYQYLYSTSPSYEMTTRADLVREELNAEGVAIPNTLELVAEYAADLSFELTALNPGSGRLEIVGLPGWADDTSGYAAPAPGIGPQFLRAIRTTLSVRSREADRDSSAVTSGVGFLRFGVGTGGGAPYARVRTVTGDIVLNNQLGTTQ